MTKPHSMNFKRALALSAVLALALVGTAQRGRADGDGDGRDNGRHHDNDSGNDNDAKSKIGLAIAPENLIFGHRDKQKVGYGSYLVNATADCNGCHTADPSTQYTPGGNLNLGQHPKKVNAATYLGGGQDFGPVPAPGFADIVSRNITPDKTGKPAGLEFSEFKTVIRKGTDFDKWHPTCAGPPNGHCVPAPFDGSLLLVMPWPAFQDLTDYDVSAIYEYLSSVQCLEGDPGNPAGTNTNGKRCK